MTEILRTESQLPNLDEQPPAETSLDSITPKLSLNLMRSGLTPKEEQDMYDKLKNEGKRCEGGSEGWSG